MVLVLLTSVWINKAGVAGAMAAIFVVGLSILLIAGIYGELASIFPEWGNTFIRKVILGSHASFICSGCCFSVTSAWSRSKSWFSNCISCYSHRSTKY